MMLLSFFIITKNRRKTLFFKNNHYKHSYLLSPISNNKNISKLKINRNILNL